MNHAIVMTIAEDIIDSAMKLLSKKNKDYSVDEDALAGFKFAARDAGITNYQAWLIFARKHWGALATFCRNDGQLESEPIEERLKDMINYCLLLACLIEDNNELYQMGKPITFLGVEYKPDDIIEVKDETGKIKGKLSALQIKLLQEFRIIANKNLIDFMKIELENPKYKTLK